MALGLAATLGSLSSAYAQDAAASTTSIYTATADLKNGYILTEISFVSSACQNYQLKFKLRNVTTGKEYDFGFQRVLAVMNQPATYTQRSVGAGGGAGTGILQFGQNDDGNASWGWNATGITASHAMATLTNGDTVMRDLKSTGYELAFELPNDPAHRIVAEDSIEICMVSVVAASECKGCGVGGTDMVFTPSDIDAACLNGENGYGNRGGDMIACYQRQSKAGNYEGWILDGRDCHPYRVVQMPDGRWWFAQNLNYHSMNNPTDGGGYASMSPEFPERTNSGAATVASPSDNVLRTAWCPGGETTPQSGSTEAMAVTGPQAACRTYGALYSWSTAMSQDGVATDATDAALQYAAEAGRSGTRRGICPAGWYMPSRYDWGKMLNTIEAENVTTNPNPCPSNGDNPATGDGKSLPCFHNYQTYTNSGWAGSRHAFKDLISTDVGKFRGTGTNTDPAMAGTPTNYADTTRAGAFLPPAVLAYPDRSYIYATDANPAWSYFLPETAGTDKYGFSIKPTGVRSLVGGGRFDYRGTFAGFWTSSHENNGAFTPQYATAANAFMVGFRYNYRHNADINSGIMSWAWDKKYGLAVRCIAQQ